MKAEYKRDMNHNYLILYQEEPVDTASYQVRMLGWECDSICAEVPDAGSGRTIDGLL